jgi:hypothetical protein
MFWLVLISWYSKITIFYLVKYNSFKVILGLFLLYYEILFLFSLGLS